MRAPVLRGLRARALRAALLLPLLAGTLAGCEAIGFVEPGLRDGQWRPTGANEANLRLMADRPDDLRRGRDGGPARADGHVAATAVERYREGRIRTLPAVSTAPGLAGTGN